MKEALIPLVVSTINAIYKQIKSELPKETQQLVESVIKRASQK